MDWRIRAGDNYTSLQERCKNRAYPIHSFLSDWVPLFTWSIFRFWGNCNWVTVSDEAHIVFVLCPQHFWQVYKQENIWLVWQHDMKMEIVINHIQWSCGRKTLIWRKFETESIHARWIDQASWLNASHWLSEMMVQGLSTGHHVIYS